MKTLTKVMLSVLIGIVFSISAAFAGDVPFSGFLGDKSVYEKLKPGPEGGAKLRWLKPGVDFKTYDKFMVDSVIFYFSDQSKYKGIDPQVMKEMADSFNKEIVAALKDKYPIVAEPGPDVARISIAITNIKASKPGVSAVTSIVPIGMGVSAVKRGATGGWTGGGETCAEVMIRDSSSDEVIVMALDEQKASFGSRFSKWGSATDAFKFWSGRIATFMDETKGIKREPAK